MTIINFQYKFVFLANKKCASTTLHQILKKYGGLVSDQSIYARPIGKHDNLMEVKAFLKSGGYDYREFKFLTTIREPIDRIYSSYKYEVLCGYLDPSKIGLEEYYLKGRYYRHFQDINFFTMGSGDNLKIVRVEDLESDFANQIKEILDWLRIPNKNDNNNANQLSRYNSTEEIFQKKYPKIHLELLSLKNNSNLIFKLNSRHKYDYKFYKK